jgi:hypothetical protein
MFCVGVVSAKSVVYAMAFGCGARVGSGGKTHQRPSIGSAASDGGERVPSAPRLRLAFSFPLSLVGRADEVIE